jgi:hypothetical protein
MIPLDINKIKTEIEFQEYLKRTKSYKTIDEWLLDSNPYSKWNITETDKSKIQIKIKELDLLTDMESRNESYRLNKILKYL